MIFATHCLVLSVTLSAIKLGIAGLARGGRKGVAGLLAPIPMLGRGSDRPLVDFCPRALIEC